MSFGCGHQSRTFRGDYVLFVLLAAPSLGGAVVLQLPEGRARGALESSAGGAEYHSFYGLPYALPPTGHRRFMRPEPVVSWGGEVGGDIVECAQEDSGREEIFRVGGSALRGQEDCLVANIYTPARLHPAPAAPSLAVLVFVHGGGYFAGSASPGVYGPEYIMDYGVILVTLNYRLGPFGFLSLGDDAVPGNQGLWDLVLGLEFVRKNIKYFGGDRDRVTLVGHSAGAMAAQFLLLRPRVSGLFRAAILQSGPVLSAYSCGDHHPAHYARSLGAALGCSPHANSSQLLSCLRAAPASEVVRHVRVVDQQPDVVRNAPNPWKPILDGSFLPADSAFLAGDPHELLKAGRFHDIPVIIGHTKDEGLYAVTEAMSRNSKMADVIFNEWSYKRGPGYLFGREEEGVSEAEKQIANDFLKTFLDNGSSRDPRLLQNMFGPSIWTAPTLRTAELLSLGKKAPTYLYHYTHRGALSLADLLSFPLWKLLLKMAAASLLSVDLFPNTHNLNCSTHFDEILVMFKGRNIPFLQRYTAGDKFVSDVLLNLWTNFAKNLTPVITVGNRKIVWEPFHAQNNRNHLVISAETIEMQNLSIFENITNFFGRVYDKVPPSIHLWRSKTWKNSTFYANYEPRNAHLEL